MPDVRKPVTPRPFSCQRGGCGKRAEFQINSKGEPNATLACSAHLVEMLHPADTQTVTRVIGE